MSSQQINLTEEGPALSEPAKKSLRTVSRTDWAVGEWDGPPEATIYARPRRVMDVRRCTFYHTMDLPGYGCVEGAWDLRRGLDEYLGHVDFAGQRVLDVGAANGCLTFFMEGRGAEVVSYDLSPAYSWDVVPFSGAGGVNYSRQRWQHLRKLNNAYWLCHRALKSQARMVHGTVYQPPAPIGPVDSVVCGSILLHLRDPFLALQNLLRFARRTAIITDVIPRRQFLPWLLGRFFRPQMTFLPRFETGEPRDTWWSLGPEIVRRFIGVLGFEDTRITYHTQLFRGSRRLMYTVVGRRTKPAYSASQEKDSVGRLS
jgi:hypothetical protein